MIKYPNTHKNEPLAVLITPSANNKDTFTKYLLDASIAVAGPFDNVDSARMFLRRQNANIIIFDRETSENEFKSFIQFLEEDNITLPIVIITNRDVKIDYDELKIVNMPVDPYLFQEIVNNFLLKNINDPKVRKTMELVKFINSLFQQVIDILPNSSKYNIEKIIDKNINQLALRNSEFLRKREESHYLIFDQKTNDFNPDNILVFLKIIIDDIINDINKVENADWGRDLVMDAMQQYLLNNTDVPEYIQQFVNSFGLNTAEIKNVLQNISNNIVNVNQIGIAFLYLSDLGPQVEIKYSKNSEIENKIDETLAALVITLVGQGSSYHEGLFGPVPIPSVDNITGIIYSKMMKGDIQDSRMGGSSLGVLLITAPYKIMEIMPKREEIIDIFQPFIKIENKNEMNLEILKTIFDKFVKCVNQN